MLLIFDRFTKIFNFIFKYTNVISVVLVYIHWGKNVLDFTPYTGSEWRDLKLDLTRWGGRTLVCDQK